MGLTLNLLDPAREPATPGAAALTATLIIGTEAARLRTRVVIGGEGELGSHRVVVVFLKSTLKAAALFPFEMKEPPDKPNSYVSKPNEPLFQAEVRGSLALNRLGR